MLVLLLFLLVHEDLELGVEDAVPSLAVAPFPVVLGHEGVDEGLLAAGGGRGGAEADVGPGPPLGPSALLALPELTAHWAILG